MNKTFIIGNLARDPELANTTNGVSVCRFTVAVSRRDADKTADFFNCIAWRELGNVVAKYLKKGKKVAVVGRLQNRTYEDSEGVKRFVTEIVAEDIEFLSAAETTEAAEKKEEPKKEAKPIQKKMNFEELPEIDDDADLPF